jgi:phosphate acyltransferase
VFMRSVYGIDKPRVALLNVGAEETKGNAAAQSAYQLLKANPHINFIGNAEGWDLPTNKADVYVCDGFIGNIVLKMCEGYYPMLKAKLPHDPDIEGFNYEMVGGLPFLGVNGSIMVGHGMSSPLAFQNMVLRTMDHLRAGLTHRIAESLLLEAV